ncbi:hypothetical protein PR048_025305 [Dryococelus australis]|uniref:Uncharacterized protein n=1 Tax=Dryococelus australis TaxID=614101 RepID=A0ABQ9GQY4_9NEOP|nr:hypothetical protein PR048_025305 [Dryococelus australis]
MYEGEGVIGSALTKPSYAMVMPATPSTTSSARWDLIELTLELRLPGILALSEPWIYISREIETSIETQGWSGAGMQGWRERECPEKTHQQAASPSTIPKCENPGVDLAGIEPGSPWWEASALATMPPLPRCPNVKMDQRRNARTGEMGNPRENPPSSGIIQHDSDIQKSESDPAG